MKGVAIELPPTTEATSRWLTPLWVIRALGDFDLDPAGAPNHPTADRVWFPENGHDGLSERWYGRVWLNPPYGRLAAPWLRRIAAYGNGTALIFARTDTALFHETVWQGAHAVLFLRGRLTFARADGSAPAANAGAASCLVAYGAENARRLEAAGLPGAFVSLIRGDATAPRWREHLEAERAVIRKLDEETK